MNNWTIRWNFDKESYAPGESALISFLIENTNDAYLYISNLSLKDPSSTITFDGP